MSEPIKVGDLVQIIKPSPCCGSDRTLGMTFVVQNMDMAAEGECAGCGAPRRDISVHNPITGNWIEAYRLKRIPPLDELEGEKQDEEITA